MDIGQNRWPYFDAAYAGGSKVFHNFVHLMLVIFFNGFWLNLSFLNHS
jgi:hypothetical protein